MSTTPVTPSAADSSKGKSAGGNGGFPHLFRLMHWLLTGSVLVLILTGFSLHAVARPAFSIFSGFLPDWMWGGRVNLWHLLAAMVFAPAVIASLLVCWNRGLRKRPVSLWLLVGGLVMVVTGVLMLNPTGSIAGHKAIVLAHASFGLMILPALFLWHLVGGLTWKAGLLVDSFRPFRNPRWVQVALFVPLALATTWALANQWPLRMPGRTLHVKHIETPVSGIDLSGLPWNETIPLTIATANGSGFDSGQTAVTVRALHDGNDIFVRAEWLDPTETRQYTPWQKTDQGWEHLVTNAADECVYYEDKFSMLFPIQPDSRFEQVGCALYCHAGGDNRYGKKEADSLVDVWHWKSTRTDPVGQLDDKYWGNADPTSEDRGRHGDPETGGGYKANGEKKTDHPAFLPDDFASVRQGIIPAEHAKPYDEAAAQAIPPGTIVPGMVVSAFEGDRGDVSCESHHEDGKWTLLIRRKLNTGSEFDTAFEPGESYSFGCAAFDCTSKRHSYALPVYWMELEP
ncbi:MAG: ethylbenzene dehydrogenase-related protein [Planctomycetota bacterium]